MATNTVPVSAGEAFDVLQAGWQAQTAGAMRASWMLHGRPGTAGAMLALQKLVADVMGATAFAIGTSLGGYETVAIIGTLLALTGAGGLYLVDRNHWLMPATQ